MKSEGTEKIISVSEAAVFVAESKGAGKTVGCLSGSFDVMTAIHFKALYERSLKCDVLIVLLNSDSSIRAYKGYSRPYVSEEERGYVLVQSPHVAKVVMFDELTPVAVLDKIKPDIFFNVSEWGQDCTERTVVEKNGGKIMLFDFDISKSWYQSGSELIRAIVRKTKEAPHKAIFLDRDGVINENKEGYIHAYKDFEFTDGAIQAMKTISDSDYKLIIITNQSGVGRGMYTQSDVEKLHSQVIEFLQTKEIKVDGVYFCPHHPDDRCICRKPGTQLFLEAVKEHNLDLSKSWFVGDSLSDVEAGLALNLKTIFVTEDAKTSAQYRARNLLEAVQKYISQ